MKQNRTDFLGIPSLGDGSVAIGRGAREPATGIEKWLLRRLAAAKGAPDIRIRLWDGTEVSPRRSGSSPGTGLVIRERASLWRLLWNTDLAFGDDYSIGRLEVEGGLVPFLEAVKLASARGNPQGLREQLRGRLLRVSGNTLAGSKRNIHHHYDLSNEFYSLWLDGEMQYTCAYFPSPEATLETAQLAKLEHVCRKLRLTPGETVYEAGCGWGGLARYMARRYGVKVRAYNISTEQVRYARERARAEGLADRIEYVEDDYRNMRGECDAFVSVGMLEHVGVDHYSELGAVIDRCLTQDGRGLIHTIGKNRPVPMSSWIERRIFPGACPPTLRQMMDILEPWSFSVVDVENLRPHYARTLEHWLDRFEAHVAEVEAMFDVNFVRAWRLYLASSTAAFRMGELQLFQLLFARPRKNDLPWTRDHLYPSAGS